MPQAKLALEIAVILYFWPRAIRNVFEYKTCVDIDFGIVKCKVHNVPPLKHSIIEKKISA